MGLNSASLRRTFDEVSTRLSSRRRRRKRMQQNPGLLQRQTSCDCKMSWTQRKRHRPLVRSIWRTRRQGRRTQPLAPRRNAIRGRTDVKEPQVTGRRGLVGVAACMTVGSVGSLATSDGTARKRPMKILTHGGRRRKNANERITKAGRPARGRVETQNRARGVKAGAGLTNPLRPSRRRETNKQGYWAANSPCWSGTWRHARRGSRVGWSCVAVFVEGLTGR